MVEPKSSGPAASRPGTQSGREGPPRTLEEGLARLELYGGGRGHLVVSDGSVDLRLSVERGRIELDVEGAPLPPAGASPEKAIIRAVLQALFWTNPALDVTGNRAAVSGSPADAASDRPRLRVERPDAPREVCRAILDEAAKLDPVRKRVPSLQVVAGPTPTTKGGKAGDAVAAKLRAALAAKTELPLADWASAEKVDPVDAVRAFSDLLDAGEARVARKQDPNAVSARTTSALGGGGLVPGLRLERAARSLTGRDDGLAARAWRRAGWARFAAGRFVEAMDDFEVALATEAGKADDLGIEAREGLIASLDAQADALRRTSQESDPQLAVESKRNVLELGRAYLQLGLMNRARAALERALDDRAAPGTQLELVGAQIAAGQLARAVDRAEQLAPKLDRDARRSLALKLVQAGAKGPSLDRVLALAGIQKDRQLARGLLAAGGVALLVGVAIGAQAAALNALAAASDQVAKRIATEGPAAAHLEEPLASVAGQFSFLPAGKLAGQWASHVSDVAHDASELASRRAALLWRQATDAGKARAALKGLVEAVRTEELRVGLKAALARFDAWSDAAASDIESLRTYSTHADVVNSLDTARRVLATYPAFRDRWKDILIPVRIETVPAEVSVEWNGIREADGTTLVYLPIENGSGTLKIVPDSASYASVERRVTLDDGPVLRITLERRASANDGRRAATTPSSTGGSNQNPTGNRPRIKISADPQPAPVDDAPPNPEKPSNFSVAETAGSDLQSVLGGSSITVAATPGFFDFLKSELGERFRLQVEVVSAARDNKVWLDGVRLHLEDLALGKPIVPHYVELDPPCERPLRGLESGGRQVEPLGRTLHLDASKLRSDLTDELRSMISDFNRREQSSGR